MIENGLWFLALVVGCVSAYALGHADGRDLERDIAERRESERTLSDLEQAGRLTP